MDYQTALNRLKNIPSKDIPRVAVGAGLSVSGVNRLKYAMVHGNLEVDDVRVGTLRRLADFFDSETQSA